MFIIIPLLHGGKRPHTPPHASLRNLAVQSRDPVLQRAFVEGSRRILSQSRVHPVLHLQPDRPLDTGVTSLGRLGARRARRSNPSYYASLFMITGPSWQWSPISTRCSQPLHTGIIVSGSMLCTASSMTTFLNFMSLEAGITSY